MFRGNSVQIVTVWNSFFRIVGFIPASSLDPCSRRNIIVFYVLLQCLHDILYAPAIIEVCHGQTVAIAEQMQMAVIESGKDSFSFCVDNLGIAACHLQDFIACSNCFDLAVFHQYRFCYGILAVKSITASVG